jgi:outer membrane protein
MKKDTLTLILSIVAAAISCALLVLFFTMVMPRLGKKSKAAEASGESITSNGQVAYIQLDSLMNQYDMYNDLSSALESKANKVQSDLQRRGNKLNSDMQVFQNSVNKGLMIRSEAERQQQDLLQRQQTLQNEANTKQQELAEENQVMLNQVLDALHTYLKTYNEDHSYSLIFVTSGTPGTIIIGDPALDITNDVVKGMNEEYVKTRSSKKSSTTEDSSSETTKATK